MSNYRVEHRFVSTEDWHITIYTHREVIFDWAKVGFSFSDSGFSGATFRFLLVPESRVERFRRMVSDAWHRFLGNYSEPWTMLCNQPPGTLIPCTTQDTIIPAKPLYRAQDPADNRVYTPTPEGDMAPLEIDWFPFSDFTPIFPPPDDPDPAVSCNLP